MLTNKFTFIASIIVIGMMPQAHAVQNIGNHSGLNGTTASHASVVLTQVDIDIESGGSSNELEFDSIAVDYSKRYRDSIDLIAQAGLLYDVQATNCDGNGLFLGGGARTKLTDIERVSVYGYALLNYASFDMDCGAADIDSSLLSLHVGPVATYEVNTTLSVYGGIDLIALSDGSSDDTDIEHADILNINAGARGTFQEFDWHARISIVGETGISVSLGKSF